MPPGALSDTAAAVVASVTTAAEIEDGQSVMPRCGSGTELFPIISNGSGSELFPTINKNEPEPATPRPRMRLPNCSWLYITTTVNADGKVYPCCVTAEGGDFVGDVHEQDSHVTAFWNNKQYQAARLFSTRGIETGVETVCHRCPIGGIAGGH